MTQVDNSAATNPPPPGMLVRKLWPHEREAYLSHLRRLDPVSRVWRFGAPIGDEGLAAHAAAHFNVDSLVYGALDKGVVRAAGELHVPWHDARQPAEAALSVEDGWRRRGLGAAIFDLLLMAARNRGRTDVVIVCKPDNLPMLRLAQSRCGERFTRLDAETGRIALSLRTPGSVWRELSRDAADLAGIFPRP